MTPGRPHRLSAFNVILLKYRANLLTDKLEGPTGMLFNFSQILSLVPNFILFVHTLYTIANLQGS